MGSLYVLTDYVETAIAQAVYEKLEDGTYAGKIPGCTSVVALGASLRACEEELRSTLEDWILMGLELGHTLPVPGEIDLSRTPSHVPADAL
jgi:predicted RNase H-like HicB family nuclease